MARIALTRDKIVQATIELAGKIGLSNVVFRA
jgi:DNA-binding transcriptional regulator YbjK